MNYAQTVIDRINTELPGLAPDLATLYALLALTVGQSVTLADVHDAWSVWRTRTRPDHPSLVPFGELSPEVQDLDQQYRDGIHRVAGRLGDVA